MFQSNTIKNILLFLIVNIVGFALIPLTYALAVYQFKIIAITDTASLNALSISIEMASVAWFVCLVFSFGLFFLEGQWKKFFAAMPIVAPLTLSIISLL